MALREPVAGQELIEFCKVRMAAYRYPRLVEVVDEVPKTTTGKFLRLDGRGWQGLRQASSGQAATPISAPKTPIPSSMPVAEMVNRSPG